MLTVDSMRRWDYHIFSFHILSIISNFSTMNMYNIYTPNFLKIILLLLDHMTFQTNNYKEKRIQSN